jgi:peptidoglycan/xylan/chitin deacetylase (PgdA/CDA1 family)
MAHGYCPPFAWDQELDSFASDTDEAAAGNQGDDSFMTLAGRQPLLRIAAMIAIAGSAVMPAVAQETGTVTPSAAPAAADACIGRTDVLGVSRTVEIDTSGGPRFGVPGPEPYPLLEDKEVILTFDDGPVRRFTLPVLDALDAECTKATFFAVGRMALADPQTLRETAQRGHTIATHTWSHKRLDRIGAAKSKDEIELGFSAIQLALGQPVAPFFRFPYLGESQAMRNHLKARGIANMAIDVDSRDFLTRNPSVMRKTVMSQLAQKGKGIILFHDIQPSTAAGLRSLLGELKAKGYRIVHAVPKSPVATLPEYDAMAEREAQRRKLALKSQPLADRSAVWPIAPGEPEQLPWSSPPVAVPASAPPPPAAAPALKPRIDDDSWATNPLGRP